MVSVIELTPASGEDRPSRPLPTRLAPGSGVQADHRVGWQVKGQRHVLIPDVKFIVLAKETCDCGSGEKRSKCCHTHNSVGDGIREAILKMCVRECLFC